MGQHLLQLRNYTGLMAVLAAFNCSAVHRLRKSVKELRPALRTAQAELAKVRF